MMLWQRPNSAGGTARRFALQFSIDSGIKSLKPVKPIFVWLHVCQEKQEKVVRQKIGAP
jgi:hypothetical protein